MVGFIYLKKGGSMIIIPEENEKYQDYINRILSSRNNLKDDNVYMEQHHITPKSLGGNDTDNNLIWLYAEEHYYAHKLLALENPHEKKLQYAWWNMCHCQGRGDKRDFIPSAEEYAQARHAFIKNMSGENNPYYGHSGEKATWYGKTHSKESREKISKARKAKGKKEKSKPTIQFTEQQKRLMSEHHYDCSGSNNPRAKAVRCVETGQIFGTAKEAGEYYNLTPSNPGSTIRRACKVGSTSGFDTVLNIPLHWEYINEDIV